MLSSQATLEASNEALIKQAAANASNVDLVEKIKKEGKVLSFPIYRWLYMCQQFISCTQATKVKEEGKDEEGKEEDTKAKEKSDDAEKYATMEKGTPPVYKMH